MEDTKTVSDGKISIKLLINSSKKLSNKLLETIKNKMITIYIENTGEEHTDLSSDNIELEVNIRNLKEEMNESILEKDYLFSAINVADKPFGAVKIIRENEFTGEDITCFQTVVKQVSLPLESAILYEEIKEKNLKLEKLEKQMKKSQESQNSKKKNSFKKKKKGGKITYRACQA